MLKMKKTAVILTGVLSLTALAPAAALAAPATDVEVNQQSVQQTEINTPTDYISWLKGQEGAEDAAQKFSDMSQSDQEKFIKYINDPEVIKTITNAIATSKGDDKISLNGGDITVRTEQTVTPSRVVSPQAKDYAVQQRATSTIMGIEVVQVRERVEYRVEGTPSTQRVTEVLNGGGVVDKYWVPMGRMDVKDDKGYVNSSGLATQRSVFTTSFVHPKFGLVVATNNFTVYGNKYGNLDGWVFN
ncbi:hypothetical protein NS115_03565 [Paenibacillus jamilae]|uniref:Uncharacterized protein n=1 Tax=Paenibacillus jamilae TaxID=114136 RepID=A0ACC5A0K8_9BACL|nr:hypothetical protein [Paenibacillus jamilae]KTS84425.1 hypothetical protein NS115_03565 [Paenibacillus jamilae]